MSRKSRYEQLADRVSATLRERGAEKKPWREAIAAARGLSRVLGMCPSIQDGEGHTISETNDGRLRIGEEEASFADEELDQALASRGLQDHLWH